MKDRNLHPLTQRLFDDEAVGGFDVFQVDAAEGGFERSDHFNESLRVLFSDLDIDGVDSGKFLKEHRLAFHDRFGSKRSNVPQPQDGRFVGDDRYQVAAVGVAVRRSGVSNDLLTRGGYPGGVGKRQIALVGEGFGGQNRPLAGGGVLVVIKRGLMEFDAVRCM